MVLADREHVESELLGEHALLDQVPHPLLRGDPGGEVGKSGKSKFHGDQISR